MYWCTVCRVLCTEYGVYEQSLVLYGRVDFFFASLGWIVLVVVVVVGVVRAHLNLDSDLGSGVGFDCMMRFSIGCVIFET